LAASGVSNVPGLAAWALRPIRIVDAMLARSPALDHSPALLRRFAHLDCIFTHFGTSLSGRALAGASCAISVPFIEETFFRGIVLGILLADWSESCYRS